MTRRTARRQFLPRLTGLVAIVTAAAAFVVLAAIPAEPRFAAEPGADPRPGKAVPWKAGVAKAVITPEKAVWLAGYGSKRAPDGKLHDLWMKALALEDEKGRRAVLITSDFQGVPKEMSDRVFEQLRTKFGLERHQVMFTFSHNHCGPRLGDDLVDYYPVEAEQVKLVDEYTALMVEKAVAVVGESLAKLAPASLRIGEGKTTFAVNRRNNREADVPAMLAKGTPLAGPVDHAVPVMTVTRPEGSLVAILFGYACHPTTLSFTTWCGDYPGFAQLELEQDHPGATAMFVNTCGGDQNPLPRRSVELCQRYGHMLAIAVEEAHEATVEARLVVSRDGVRVCRAAVPEGRHARGTDRRASGQQRHPRPLGRADAAEARRGREVPAVVSVSGARLAARQGDARHRPGGGDGRGLRAAIQA